MLWMSTCLNEGEGGVQIRTVVGDVWSEGDGLGGVRIAASYCQHARCCLCWVYNIGFVEVFADGCI